MEKKHIVVCGAGIMGISVAYSLLLIPNTPYKVTVVSEFFSPGTLSDRSVGIWGPYLPGVPKEGPDYQKVLRWGKVTKERLWKLMKESVYNEWAIYPSTVWMLSRDPVPDPAECPYKEITDDFYVTTRPETPELPEEWNSAMKYTAPQIIPNRYLRTITEKVQKMGATFVRQTIKSFAELEQTFPEKVDAFVNCLGLGSKNVVHDELLQPIRGVLVKLPPIPKYFCLAYESLIENAVTYAVFRPDCTLLGGTALIGDWTKQNSPEDVQKVLDRNYKLLPDLRNYEWTSDWSGLRPGRTVVRLEADLSLAKVPVVHNYGHGGAGWSLHWGCADDVIEILEAYFAKPKL